MIPLKTSSSEIHLEGREFDSEIQFSCQKSINQRSVESRWPFILASLVS